MAQHDLKTTIKNNSHRIIILIPGENGRVRYRLGIAGITETNGHIVLKTNQAQEQLIIPPDVMVMNIDKKQVFILNKQVPFTTMEFKLLELLLRHKETYVAREVINIALWGSVVTRTNVLDVTVKKVRDKLKSELKYSPLKTLEGGGYGLFFNRYLTTKD